MTDKTKRAWVKPALRIIEATPEIRSLLEEARGERKPPPVLERCE